LSNSSKKGWVKFEHESGLVGWIKRGMLWLVMKPLNEKQALNAAAKARSKLLRAVPFPLAVFMVVSLLFIGNDLLSWPILQVADGR